MSAASSEGSLRPLPLPLQLMNTHLLLYDHILTARSRLPLDEKLGCTPCTPTLSSRLDCEPERGCDDPDVTNLTSLAIGRRENPHLAALSPLGRRYEWKLETRKVRHTYNAPRAQFQATSPPSSSQCTCRTMPISYMGKPPSPAGSREVFHARSESVRSALLTESQR